MPLYRNPTNKEGRKVEPKYMLVDDVSEEIEQRLRHSESESVKPIELDEEY